MTLESLLLSQDPELVRVIRPTLEELSIEVEVCPEAGAGADVLVTDKFDAVIVDCDDLTGGLALLQGLRNTPSNKNSVAFAILNGKRTTTQEAFRMGANFVQNGEGDGVLVAGSVAQALQKGQTAGEIV